MTKLYYGKSGFSLIELLVVLGVMVFATGLFVSFSGGGDGAALGSAQRVLTGVTQGARGQAVLKNTATRLIIHNDPADLDKYRRYVGIICESKESAGEWIAATQGVYLPEGIYFDPQLSALKSGGSWSELQSMSLDYPRSAPRVDGSGEDFAFFDFNANGTAGDPNAWIVIRAATLDSSSADGSVVSFRADASKERVCAALILRRAGTATMVTDPSAIIPAIAAVAATVEIQ